MKTQKSVNKENVKKYGKLVMLVTLIGIKSIWKATVEVISGLATLMFFGIGLYYISEKGILDGFTFVYLSGTIQTVYGFIVNHLNLFWWSFFILHFYWYWRSSN